MPPIYPTAGRNLVKILERLGFTLGRIEGSHHVMHNSDGRMVSVPVHGNLPLPRGLIAKILRESGVSVSDYEKHR